MKKQNKRNIKKNRKKIIRKNQISKPVSQETERKIIENWFGGSFSDELLKMGGIQKLTPKQIEKKQFLGENVLQSIIKNRNSIVRYFNTLKEGGYNEDLFKIFQYKVLYPYFSNGNKYMKNFEKFYELISMFNLSNNPKKQVTLFRCMDEEEYKRLMNGGGVESPSFGSCPSYITFLRNSSTLIDVEKRNVFVCCGFDSRDIISEIVITGENEVLIRKDSQPKFVFKYSEYGKENLDDDFGGNVIEYLPLKPSEIDNGFSYMEGLENKGWVNPKKQFLVGNQYMNKTLSEWSKKYYFNVVDVLEKVSFQYPEYMDESLKKRIEDYKQQLSEYTKTNKDSNTLNSTEYSFLKKAS